MHYLKTQSLGEYDFDLEYPSGDKVPLEVTTSTEQSLKKMSAAIDKGGLFVARDKCKKDWWVHPLPSANTNKIRRRVDEYLATIECEGFERFSASTDASLSPSVRRILRDLRIEGGSVMPWSPPGRIGIALPGAQTCVTAEDVRLAIEKEALKPDNRTKLGKSQATERHLFVYVSECNFPAWIALVKERPPENAPILPREISHVWVAAQIGTPGRYVVWTANRTSGWQDLGVVTLSSIVS
jgi:hypothetical protein